MRPDVELRDVGSDQDCSDALEVLRLAPVDRLDPGVKVRAPEQAGAEHARQGHVVDVVGLADDVTWRIVEGRPIDGLRM
jgi:hypothetical protein